jgi:hypothetical protein
MQLELCNRTIASDSFILHFEDCSLSWKLTYGIWLVTEFMTCSWEKSKYRIYIYPKNECQYMKETRRLHGKGKWNNRNRKLTWKTCAYRSTNNRFLWEFNSIIVSFKLKKVHSLVKLNVLLFGDKCYLGKSHGSIQTIDKNYHLLYRKRNNRTS